MRNVGVRASAGSGKTYELAVQFIARLAAGADPASVVATTFTRKAAGEILDRIIMRLSSAAEPGEPNAKSDALRQDVLRVWPDLDLPLGAEQWLRLLAGCCRAMDRINIATIDSLFVRALSAFLFEAELVGRPAMTDERSPEATATRAMALQEALAAKPLSSALELLEDLSGGRPSRSVIGRMDQAVSELLPLALATDPRAWETLTVPPSPDDRELDDAIVSLERMASECQSRALAKGLLSSASNARDRLWEAVLETGASAKVGFSIGHDHADDSDPHGTVTDFTYSRVPIPESAVRALRVLTQTAAHHVIRRLQARSRATRDLLDRYAVVYHRLLRQREVLLFDRLPRVLLDATRNATGRDLAYRLGLSVQHVLLDEFQDTSPAQWGVLRRLFLNDDAAVSAPSVFCVGDSKQAIYGWRGGSAAIFDRLDQEMPGLVWESRATSYRSSQVVLDFVNDVFTNLERWDGLETCPALLSQWKEHYVAHEAAEPRPGHVIIRSFREPAETQDDAAIGAADPSAESDVPEGKDTSYERWTAERIAAIALRHSDAAIGVLVRRNRTAADLAFRLQSLGVSASLDGPGALADDPAVSVILSALTMADHPGSTAEAFHVAASPLRDVVGLTDIAPATVRRASLRVRRALASRGYASVVAQWSRILARLGDERTGLRLTQLTEAAAEYEAKATQRPSDFVKAVRLLTVNEQSDQPVRVMTIHQAKGLEFDIVVLPELHTEIHGVRPPMIRWDAGVQSGVSSALNASDAAATRVFAYPSKAARAVSVELRQALAQHRERELADALNLLYVAITRPRHALHILIPAGKPASITSERRTPVRMDSILRSALADEIGSERSAEDSSEGDGDILLERGDPNWDQDPSGPSAPSAAPLAQPRPILSPVTFASHARRRIWLDSAPSRLGETGKRSARDLLRLDTSALNTGTLLHAWFQSISWLDEGVPDDDELVSIGRLTLPYEREDRLRERIATFRAILQSEAVAGAFTRPPWPHTLWRERPFVARIGDSLVRGRMDRVVIRTGDTPGPRVVVTDIKSDQVDADGASARAVGYYGQMRAYAQALGQMLGTPMAEITAQLLFVSPGVLFEVPLTAEREFVTAAHQV